MNCVPLKQHRKEDGVLEKGGGIVGGCMERRRIDGKAGLGIRWAGTLERSKRRLHSSEREERKAVRVL